MKRRLAGLALLAAAAVAWLGLALPARRERDLARAEYARAREDRERLRAQAISLERRGAARRTPQAGAEAARALRAALLQAASGVPVAGVRISAAAAQGRVAARGQLSAEGAMPAVVRLAERLAAPGSGLQVERLELAAVSAERSRAIRLQADVSLERSGS